MNKRFTLRIFFIFLGISCFLLQGKNFTWTALDILVSQGIDCIYIVRIFLFETLQVVLSKSVVISNWLHPFAWFSLLDKVPHFANLNHNVSRWHIEIASDVISAISNEKHIGRSCANRFFWFVLYPKSKLLHFIFVSFLVVFGQLNVFLPLVSVELFPLVAKGSCLFCNPTIL